jgi:peptidyl-prolyl cis-trans isomerase A (cyclophilin A)
MRRLHPLYLLPLVALLVGAVKGPDPVLLDPSSLVEEAPAQYTVKLKTNEGVVLIDVVRAWAPHGADRFYNLVQAGFYDDATFFRVLGGFMAQFGLTGDPAVNAAWHEANIPDDPVRMSNLEGRVTFATAGPGTRTTQVFISFKDNSRLDSDGFAPIGQVRDIAVANKLWIGYGEGAPMGKGPDQVLVRDEGDAYLAGFPKLDRILKATVVARSDTTSLDHLDWLVEAWAGEADGVRTEESWSVKKGGLSGVNVVTKDGAPVFSEELRVEARGGDVVYLATPEGGPQTEFLQTEFAPSRVTFENPKHDFPKRITYSLTGDVVTVFASGVEGGAERNATWVWKRSKRK